MERQTFNQKMSEVANLLGYQYEEYKDQPYDNCGQFKADGDICIFIRNGGYKNTGRIEFSSDYPHDSKGLSVCWDNRHMISITCSDAKSSQQIAKDLQRRFLPAYLTSLATIQKAVIRQNEYYENRHETISKIADHFGYELSGQDNEIICAGYEHGIGTIEPRGDNQVKFSVECSAEKAIKIIEILKE